MAKQVTIERIEIKIGSQEIALTLEEAKELKTILVDTFDGKQEIIHEGHYYEHYPYIRWRDDYEPKEWTITCGDYTEVHQGNILYLYKAPSNL
jgi:hypothetical protein